MNDTEHNPDGLTPEQVGEGWRLLRRDEKLIEGDQYWEGIKWRAVLDPEDRYPFFDSSYRRQIDPAETKQIIASKDAEIERQRLLLVANQAIMDGASAEIARLKAQIEEIGDAATWLICDPTTRLSDSGIKFLATIRNDGSNAYNDLRAEIATLRAELDAAKADSARFEWLVERATMDFFESISEYPQQARAAIDDAMKGEK